MFLVKVCRVLKKYHVPYALVGGYAVNLHGVVRGTLDIDFILDWTLKNLRNCEKALNELGLISKVPIDPEEIFSRKDFLIKEKKLIAWSFINPANPIEQIDIIITIGLKNKKTINKRVQGFDVKVLSIGDLIKMKKKSGRQQDLLDIQFLESLR